MAGTIILGQTDTPTVPSAGQSALSFPATGNSLVFKDGDSTYTTTITNSSAANRTLTISGDSTINGSLVGNITGSGTIATGGFTLTVSAASSINQNVTTTGTPSFAGLTVDTSTLYVDAGNNRVGIGTTSPNRILELYQSTPLYLRLTYQSDKSAPNWDDAEFGGVEWYTTDVSAPGAAVIAAINVTGDVSSGNQPAGRIGFLTRTTGSATERMAITAAGHLLVGTTTDDALFTLGTSTARFAISDATTVGSTKTTPGTVDAWATVIIGGSTYYMPAYTSKTT